VIESPSTFWLNVDDEERQTSETAPIVRVETSGVKWRGWMRPKIFGKAPNTRHRQGRPRRR